MIKVKYLPKFRDLYNLPGDIHTVICIGGRGGAKTYEVSKFIAFSASIKKKRCVVLRDEKIQARESILNEVLLRYDTANSAGSLSPYYERLDTGIKDRSSNEMMVFTKGFRASSNQKQANLKSISNIDIAVVEEAEDIRDEDRFNVFADSIRKEGSLIIIILNTPDVNHWIVKRYFNTRSTGHEGYFELYPKDIPGFFCIQTSFEDNSFLPGHVISNYRGYGDPGHHLYNPHYYLTAIKGYASTGRKGQILKKVKPIKFKDYMALPFREFFGQDFGTSSPAGLVGVKFDRNHCYVRQINYRPMPTLDLAKLYCSLRFNARDRIIADNADEKAWKKLRSGYDLKELSQDDIVKYPKLLSGFNVWPCIKGTDSITNGLDLMDSMELYAVEESKDLWNEIMNYVYDVDKNGEPTNDPIDDFNHLIDPWRYVVNDQRGKPSGYTIR